MKKIFQGQWIGCLAVVLSVLLFGGCNGASTSLRSGGGGSQAMTQDAYVEQVLEGMNASLSEISSLTQMLLNTKDTSITDEERVAIAEEIRSSLQALSKLTDLRPPVGWEEVHSQLVSSIQAFGEVNERYCNLLAVDGEASSQSDALSLQQDMMAAISNLMENLHALQVLDAG